MPNLLADEFRKMLTQHGWYAVHVHQDLQRPCPDCGTSEPNPRCPRCLGIGYRVSLAPILVRDFASSAGEFDAEQNTPLGIYHMDTGEGYVCLPDAHPVDRDLLAIVRWSTPRELVIEQGQVVAVQSLFEIKHAKPLRGEAGEVAYYYLATIERAIDTEWLLQQLSRRPTP